MLASKRLWIAALILGLATTTAAAGVSGTSALEFTRRAIAFGPRPPGSAANHALQNYILTELRKDGCEIVEDAFTAKTPQGAIAMKNILARFPGKGSGGARGAIAITGHFDTKLSFRDANSWARAMAAPPPVAARTRSGFGASKTRTDDVYLAFLDGEEAFGEWSDTDSLYGSRHLAERWGRDRNSAASQGPDQCGYDRRQEPGHPAGDQW